MAVRRGFKGNWVDLQKSIMAMDERSVARLLDEERRSTSPRLAIMLRLHARMNRLRTARERKEIAAAASKGK